MCGPLVSRSSPPRASGASGGGRIRGVVGRRGRGGPRPGWVLWALGLGVLCTYRRYEIALRPLKQIIPRARCRSQFAKATGFGNAHAAPIQAYFCWITRISRTQRQRDSVGAIGRESPGRELGLGGHGGHHAVGLSEERRVSGRQAAAGRQVAEACSPVAHTLKSVHSLKCG